MRIRLLCLFALPALASMPALATNVPVEGGPGGSPFMARCSGESYLVGLAGRNGTWMDQLAPICAPWLPDRHTFGPPSEGAARGTSGGGAAFRHVCPRGYAIGEWSFIGTMDTENRFQFVRSLSVTCSTVVPPADRQTFQIGDQSLSKEADPVLGGRIIYYSYIQGCPRGELAAGFQGRAGRFVDALGLVCATAPTKAGTTSVDKAQPGLDRKILQPKSGVGSVLGGNTCLSGFVPRLAGPKDTVCVMPESHDRVLKENASAASRRDPRGGPYGMNTCLKGFVWRDAFPGDQVCVTPEIRDLVRQENALGPSRSLAGSQRMTR